MRWERGGGNKYCSNSRELEEREDVGQVNEPLGHEIDSVGHEVANDGAFWLVAKCPIPRDGHTEERHHRYRITHPQPLEHLSCHRLRCSCLCKKTTTAFFTSLNRLISQNLCIIVYTDMPCLYLRDDAVSERGGDDGNGIEDSKSVLRAAT